MQQTQTQTQKQMKLEFILVLILFILFFAKDVFADDLAPAAAMSCVACHGPAGHSNNPLWPNLAAQKKDYLIKAINDYRAGRRVDPLMSPISKTLKESDISIVAEYFSSQTGN